MLPMCAHVYTFLLQNGALWDICLMHETGLLTKYVSCIYGEILCYISLYIPVDIKRTNGGIVSWRIKGVTRTRWLNVNKLINIVAFCVGSAIMIANGVHTLKLTRSFTHAVNWSSKSVVGFRSREIPSNSNSWNEINQLLVINQRL